MVGHRFDKQAIHEPERAGLGALDAQRIEGQAHRLDPPDGESPALDQLDETAAGEEPQVGRIEDATLVVVEHPEGRPEPRVPVGDVGDAEEGGPAGRPARPWT